MQWLEVFVGKHCLSVFGACFVEGKFGAFWRVTHAFWVLCFVLDLIFLYKYCWIQERIFAFLRHMIHSCIKRVKENKIASHYSFGWDWGSRKVVLFNNIVRSFWFQTISHKVEDSSTKGKASKAFSKSSYLWDGGICLLKVIDSLFLAVFQEQQRMDN